MSMACRDRARRCGFWRPALAILGVAAALAFVGRPFAAAGDDKPVNLLRLASARVESSSAPGAEASQLAALTDGDPGSVADLPGTAEAPLEVVYGFGGADVAPEAVRVTLPASGGAVAPAVRVEVLVSGVSAHAGFRSLRADPLEAGVKPALLEFLPIAARFLLVRLSPAPGAKRLAVAEVEVLGREGAPRSRYAFAESPAKAFDVLARLQATSSLSVSVSEDEKALFARARAGRLDAAGFTEAALLASGVLQAGERARYVKRLAELEQQARQAVSRARGPAAQGEALLRWLHQGPLAKGYVAAQTDLSTALDSGTFNCVSSATLFNCLALRLGLDARAIEVPTHAFSIVYDGTQHMDVETTTPEGFNPARDPAVIARFEKATGFRYIRDLHRDQRREVEEAGLAAIIYYNHGVMLAEKKRYHEALLAYFRAMSLDAECVSAVKNALAVLAQWGVELSREGRYEQALEVVGTGLALAPEDATLRNNRLAVWQAWAENAIDAGRSDEALGILARAATAVPDGGFAERQAWVFLKAAEKAADAGRWEEALAAAAPGLEKLLGAPRAEVARWRSNLYLRWFGAEVRARRFESAAVALERGLASSDPHPGLAQNAGYLAQEWARAAAAEKGPAAALAQLRELVKRFAGNVHVTEAAGQHVRRTVRALADAGNRGEALAALEEGQDLLPTAPDRQQVAVYVFDTSARAHMKAGEWAEAAEVYAEALARFPEESLLVQNIAYLAQEWSKAAYAGGGPAEAERVARVLAEKFPGVKGAAESGANQLRRTVSELVRSGRHEEALRALEGGAALLAGDPQAADLHVFVFDSWAKARMEAGAWAEAAEVYVQALARFPAQRQLRGNAGYLAQEWARTLQGKGDATGALAALRTMSSRFPGVEDVAEAAKAHVLRTVQALSAGRKPEEALAALEAGRDLLPRERDREQAEVSVYDAWARRLAADRSWQEAVDVYAKGLLRLPGNSHLSRNAQATWQSWAKTLSDAKRWDEAIAIYDKALERFPEASFLKQNRAWCEEQKKKP